MGSLPCKYRKACTLLHARQNSLMNAEQDQYGTHIVRGDLSRKSAKENPGESESACSTPALPHVRTPGRGHTQTYIVRCYKMRPTRVPTQVPTQVIKEAYCSLGFSRTLGWRRRTPLARRALFGYRLHFATDRATVPSQTRSAPGGSSSLISENCCNRRASIALSTAIPLSRFAGVA